MSTDKKKRTDKKNRLAEVQKARGFDRGLDVDEIVGATKCSGDLMFLVRWQNCNELDLINASELNEKFPQDVIRFYESRCTLNRAVRNNTTTNVPISKSTSDEIPPVISKVEASTEEANNEDL